VAGAADCIHATCVALGGRAALLRGPSGSGKSDLALRFLHLPSAPLGAPPQLVGDDRVVLHPADGCLLASPPEALAGLIEVRGVGIITLPFTTAAKVCLVVDLVERGQIERLPDRSERVTIHRLELPLLRIWPFEASAPIKLARALISIRS